MGIGINFKFKKFTHFDFTLCFSVLALTTIGILFIYSSGINSSGVSVSFEYIKQIVWAATGFIILLFISVNDYRRIADRTFILFIIMIAMLLYTRIFGRYVNGAKSWIGIGELGIQPSEFAKIIYILYLAHYLNNSEKNEKQFTRFVKAGIIMVIPMFLILSQPDLGTSSVFFPIFLTMCFMAGIPTRYILMVFMFGVCTIVFTILPYWDDIVLGRSLPVMRVFTDFRITLLAVIVLSFILALSMAGRFIFKSKYYYWIAYVTGIILASLIASLAGGKVLKEYQIMRLIIFLNPYIDERGAGWNIIQSLTAIGSGGLFGRGFLHGTQSHYRFLPQQSTDFIFSILTEEWGFIGGITVFFLYGIIFKRGITIIKNTGNNFGALTACGIITMFAFHFMVNVGMVMGIMPITGIPLLFLSYGGSSLWTAMAAVGILMSINMRRLEG